MTLEKLHRAGGLTDIEGADDAVDACHGDDGAAVLVPVVGESFVGWEGGLRSRRGRQGVHRRSVKQDLELQMVAYAGWCAEIPEAEVRVTGDCGDDPLGMWAPLCGVGAAVGGEGEHAAFAFGVPDLDRAVPRRGGEGRLGSQVPGAGEGFTGVFGECRYREGGFAVGVEEAEGSITAGGEEMGGVGFGVADIVECVLGWVPESGRLLASCNKYYSMPYSPFHRSDALRRQL